MELDRGALAKIDRGILSGLDHNEHSKMVRVPVSEARVVDVAPVLQGAGGGAGARGRGS
jgi:hypothetical protein